MKEPQCRMRILQVVAGFGPANGVANVVVNISRLLNTYDTTVATVGYKQTMQEAVGMEDVRIIWFRPSYPHFLCFSWSFLFDLSALVKAADVVHVHGAWTFPVWWACHEALRMRKRLIRSPHGSFLKNALRKSRIRKTVVGIMFERKYLSCTDIVQVSNSVERREVREYIGERKAKKIEFAEVPNGVNPEEWSPRPARRDAEQKWPVCKNKKVVLFLSRIAETKGVDLLVEAWKQIAHVFPDWHLLIAGPDFKNYTEKISKMVDQAGLDSQTTICGPVYGDDRRCLMTVADVFVLPTRSENFGIVVAEALAAGVPVITTKGAPWQELLGSSCHSSLVHYCVSSLGGKPEDGGQRAAELLTNELMNFRTNELTRTGRAGWWVDIGVDPLEQALREAMSLTDEERQAMGENGRRLVDSKYRWETVAERMSAVYSGIVNCKL